MKDLNLQAPALILLFVNFLVMQPNAPAQSKKREINFTWVSTDAMQRVFPLGKLHGDEKIGTGVASLIPTVTCKENFVAIQI